MEKDNNHNTTQNKENLQNDKISSGSLLLNDLLNGGYEKDTITTIYGPGGSGKTLLCMLAAIEIIKLGKKVIYIDTEGNFSTERLKQICPEYEKILQNIIFMSPSSFDDQKNVFENLKNNVNDRIGLIIVDTIAMLYRLELGKSEKIFDINRELGAQFQLLTEIARNKHIPIIVANQVYSNMDDGVKMVGGDLIKYGSKCLLEIKKGGNSVRLVILKKHRSISEGKDIKIKIVETGIEAFHPGV